MEVMIPNEMRFRLDGAILFYRRCSECGYSYSAHNAAAVLHKVMKMVRWLPDGLST